MRQQAKQLVLRDRRARYARDALGQVMHLHTAALEVMIWLQFPNISELDANPKLMMLMNWLWFSNISELDADPKLMMLMLWLVV